MAKLSGKERKALPKKDFAGPGRSWPVEDKDHAEAALEDLPKAKRKGSLTLKEAQKIHAAAVRELRKAKK